MHVHTIERLADSVDLQRMDGACMLACTRAGINPCANSESSHEYWLSKRDTGAQDSEMCKTA